MSRCVVYQSGGFTNYGISYRKYSQEELAEMENRAMTENEKAINIRAIKALEEVQQYRKHGVTLESALNNMCDLAAAENLIEEYRAIGTPEECRAAVDKRTVMKPIRMDKCTCPSCGTHNEVWKKRRNTLPSDIVYCWHCGQAVEIFRRDEE